MKIIQTILLAFFVTLSFGQSLTNDIEHIYNFKPGKLTDKEQETKMPALDGFWNKVKNDTTKYLPSLRLELKTTGHNPYFYYDGSGLLLSLTSSRTDKELAIEAMSKCDLDDISQKIYVQTLNKLANEGFDVTVAAVRILSDEKYSFYLPQHAMTFDQAYCLTYMLLPQSNFKYVDTLIELFKAEKPIAQKSIITTLWFAHTCKGDSFLKSIMADNTIEKEVREYAKKTIGYTKFSKEQQAYLKAVSKEDLNDLRKAALKRFSDEAVEELEMTTMVQRRDDNCH